MPTARGTSSTTTPNAGAPRASAQRSGVAQPTAARSRRYPVYGGNAFREKRHHPIMA